MGELILHIGMQKTGSTALQSFFNMNRNTLLASSIDYPKFTQQPTNNSFINLYCQALAKKQIPERTTNDIEKNLQKLKESTSTHLRTIISHENFSVSAARLKSTGYKPELYWKTLARVLEEIGISNVTVVVYLRRQDDWIASHWRQRIKRGFDGDALDVFCKHPHNQYSMDYASMLALISAAFYGKAQIIVRPYDRGRFVGGSIYRDFCAACNIPWNERYELPENDRNPSITFDVAEALKVFKNQAPPRTPLRDDILVPLAHELSRQNPDVSKLTPFNEEDTRTLMEPYLEGNDQISNTYLNGIPTFSREYGGRPVWIPNEERITEYRRSFLEAIRCSNRAHNNLYNKATRILSKMKGKLL